VSIASQLLRFGASLLSPGGARSPLAILMYHRVLHEPDPITGEVDAALFDTQMHTLAQCFNVLPLGDAVERLQSGTLPARAAAITFDDGYLDNVEVALPILQRHRLHATFFIATGYLGGGRMFNDTVIESIRRIGAPSFDLPSAGLQQVAAGTMEEKRAAVGRVLGAVKYLDFERRTRAVEELARSAAAPLPDDLMMQPAHVRALAQAGMEIGGHTVTHPILARVDIARARNEIVTNRQALEAMAGHRMRLFAYPNGVPGKDYMPEHVALVREAGYRAAVSTSHGAARRGCDVYQLPRFTPWDRAPARFTARLLRNALVERPVVLGGVPAAAPAA
jgi:peptidoglycan/xylan/chitin deacetylase (PgdA/CDA1 family)